MKNKTLYVLVSVVVLVGIFSLVSSNQEERQMVSGNADSSEEQIINPFYEVNDIDEKKNIVHKFGEYSIETAKDTKVNGDADTLSVEYQKGIISMFDSGTNFDDVLEYLSDPRQNILNKLDSWENTQIGNYDVVVGYVNDKKIYYIISNYKIFTISTDTPELYDELDAIVQSFKYARDGE